MLKVQIDDGMKIVFGLSSGIRGAIAAETIIDPDEIYTNK